VKTETINLKITTSDILSVDEIVDKMVNRFLMWQLPEDFAPDAGIKYERILNLYPVGTNLLTATQAKEMVRFMVAGLDD